MIETGVDVAYRLYGKPENATSVEELLKAFAKRRGANVIFTFMDINGRVQIAAPERPGEVDEILRSPYCENLERVYDNGSLSVPAFLRDEFARVLAPSR